MRRLLVAIAILLICGGGVLALIWFGNYFMTYAASKHHLSVDKGAPQLLSLGTKTVLDLHGSGFNRETSVSLAMDVDNSEAVIGTFPLQGIYNESILHGDFLYLAPEEGGVEVLNVKNPRQPQFLKEYLVGRSINDIQRSGDYLYLSCGKLGISIMKIQQGGLLDHITDISMESIARQCLFVDGFLYVAAGSGGLLVYDVRQLEQVELVQVVRSGPFISKMTISDGYLYLAVSGKLIEVYQLTEPQRPLLVSSLPLPATIFDLVTFQQQLYVATKNGIFLYCLANAKHPELLQQWTGFGAARKVFAGMENVYVSDSYSGLRIIDSKIEASPDYIDLNIDPRTMTETSDYLFLAGSNKGLLIVDKNALSSRQVVRTINTLGSVRDLFIKDHWLYVADARGGVLLQDLDAEDAPFIAISPHWGESFSIDQELLFVAQSKEGIGVFNISYPGQPASVAFWPDLVAMRLSVAGDYLLASKGIGGVDLIDISDIQHPIIKDTLPNIHPLDISSEGHLVYIASKDEGLLIYEITDDAKLSRLSRLSTPFPMNHFDLAVALQVQSGIAYIANGRSGLLVVDVREPAEPTILSSIGVPGICKGIRLVANKAFVVSHHGGINIINIEDPEKPVLLNSIFMPGLSRGLQVVDDLIYVTQKEMGVTVIPVPVAAETVKLLSRQRIQIVLPSPKIPGRYNLQLVNPRESVVSDGVVTYQ